MKKTLLITVFVLSLIILPLSAFSQSTDQSNQPAQSNPLPRNYKDFYLGMSIDEFLGLIKTVNYLYYEGELDVTLYEQEKSLFKASVPPLIRKLVFYFFDKTLVLMTFYYDSKYVNLFERYKELSAKYGDPTLVDSKRFVWQDDKTLIILERTYRLKVIDKAFLDSIQASYDQIDNLIDQQNQSIFDNF